MIKDEFNAFEKTNINVMFPYFPGKINTLSTITPEHTAANFESICFIFCEKMRKMHKGHKMKIPND